MPKDCALSAECLKPTALSCSQVHIAERSHFADTNSWSDSVPESVEARGTICFDRAGRRLGLGDLSDNGGYYAARIETKKLEIINEYKKSDSDTGSPEVQVALLTKRVRDLTEHLQDPQARPRFASGLWPMVSEHAFEVRQTSGC